MEKNTSHYTIDIEGASAGPETARLRVQELLVREAAGGLFAEQPEGEPPAEIMTYLDVACGPGGWALEVAEENRYRERVHVHAFDISESSIQYAQALAQARILSNMSFRVMDATNPWDYPDQFCDLVNIQLVAGFVLPEQWPHMLQECWRVLRPGGIVRLTETDVAITNSPASEKLAQTFSEGLVKRGQSFSPDGRHIGLLPVLPKLLREAGFENIQKYPFVVNLSYGAPGYEQTVENGLMAISLLKPFYLATGMSEHDFEKFSLTYQQEITSPDFCGIQYYMTYWAVKDTLTR